MIGSGRPIRLCEVYRDKGTSRLRTVRLAIFLLCDQREFTDVVILERSLGIGRLIQIKCPRDMDFKRAGFDKAVKLLKWRRSVLAVVAFDFYAGTFFGDGFDAIGIGGASALAQRRQGLFRRF